MSTDNENRNILNGKETDGEVNTELLAVISAAVAGYLGHRATIKSVRLKRSDAWAKSGRERFMSKRNRV